MGRLRRTANLRAVLAAAGLALMLTLAPAAQAQAPADDVIWGIIKDSRDEGALQSFIANFPESRHSQAAKARLASLEAAKPKPKPRVIPARPAEPPKPASPPPAATSTTPPTTTTPPTVPAGPPRHFAQPRAGPQDGNGLRIDWCHSWARDCGKPSADAFCRTQGYTSATSFERVITGSYTWIAGDQQICLGPGCGVIADVTCERPTAPQALPTKATISQPQVNRAPLANCHLPSRSCGQASADAFCRAAGFARADRFGGSAEGTRSVHMGDGSVCDGPQCRALSDIVCSR